MRATGGVRGERRRAVQERGRGGEASARLGPLGGALEIAGDLLVGAERRPRAVPGAPVGVELRVDGLGQRGVQCLALAGRGRAVRGRAHERVPEPHLDCRSPADPSPPRARRRRGRCRAVRPPATGAAARRPGRPPRAAAACAWRREAARGGAGIRPRCCWTATAGPGRPKPPASSAALMPRGSSSSASGLPCVSATIRSRTRSSIRPGMTVASRARASASPRPVSHSSGRSASRRSALGSRTREEQRDRLGQQPPGDEAERLRGGVVEPLQVVHAAQQRLLLGGRGQQAEHRERHQEAVGRVARDAAECHVERVLLRLGQRVELARAAARTADAAPRTAAPSPTRRR